MGPWSAVVPGSLLLLSFVAIFAGMLLRSVRFMIYGFAQLVKAAKTKVDICTTYNWWGNVAANDEKIPLRDY
jgi:hypothetical protein